MHKVNLLGYTVADLENLMQELGQLRFKGRQLFKWLYAQRQPDFSRMTDISKSARAALAEKFCFKGLAAEKISRSTDGTEKYLFRLDDGKLIEAVMIPDEAKRTVCISSQVGCSLGCLFCATGKIGFGRNLTAGEIVGQLLFLRQRFGDSAFQNIVFMGMGEPLLNYENVLKAVSIITSEIGLAVAARKITISTAGVVPKILALADSDTKVRLAISLHAATDDKRGRLMPIARAYNLERLMEAARYYALKRKRRITFEYILFEGFNDSIQDVKALSKLIRGIPCKINILAYNPVAGFPFRRPSEDKVNEFGKQLYPRAPAVTVRKSRGIDIDAACGQLAGKYQS
ncbi:MAG: 23S rRNA (adenine(2503)-C(2))-methyltransferase RlmN [Candidatus Zixiibacteriota bacterium]